jgi:hypothetical protein
VFSLVCFPRSRCRRLDRKFIRSRLREGVRGAGLASIPRPRSYGGGTVFLRPANLLKPRQAPTHEDGSQASRYSGGAA